MSEQSEYAEPEAFGAPAHRQRRKRKAILAFVAVFVAVALLSAGVSALLVNIFTRKQEAKNPYLRFVEVSETTTDPEVWGMNFPRQYDSYKRTVDASRTRYGGSEAMPQQKLDRDPWLKRMFSGYAFSIDYRDRRGHAYMLGDQEVTKRVTDKPQPGACLHCHASIAPTYARIGIEKGGASPDNYWGAVMKGFPILSAMTYAEAHAELVKTPDGSSRLEEMGVPATSPTSASSATHPTTQQTLATSGGKAHPVSCVDCHDPKSMELRVTRPGFILGIAALAKSSDSVPHLPSIERWRESNRATDYDPNRDASRQEMRSFVCGQCHVEYYCGPKETLFFPWNNGLKVEQIEKTYDEHKFPNGEPFYDWAHGETGTHALKAQHPEFELWSQGTHARAGVACADCHMPYMRQGAMKVSDHWVRSPLLNVNRACQTCHAVPESELLARANGLQDRTHRLTQRSSVALVEMLDAIKLAKANGATEEQLKPALDLHRKAQWRLDFIAAENSMGFHAAPEAARVLAESIDFSRQGQLVAQKLLLQKDLKPSSGEGAPVEGVTPEDRAPVPDNPKFPGAPASPGG
jgi:nitrite reductase (cytochrome c-552)